MLVLVAGACVDNRANALEFCDRHEELIAVGRDGETLTEAEAKGIERDIEKSMRDAEDATRPVRRSARDLLDAYDDIGRLAGDDDPDADEVVEVEGELQQAREDLRAACASVLEADE